MGMLVSDDKSGEQIIPRKFQAVIQAAARAQARIFRFRSRHGLRICAHAETAMLLTPPGSPGIRVDRNYFQA
jgi:hypothetical protein